MRTALEKRYSVRTYTAPPSEAQTAFIDAALQKLNAASGLTAAYLADGAAAFASRTKTYGMFKNVQALILLKGPQDLPHLCEAAGYYGQALVLDLWEQGVGSCWVGGTFDKEKLAVPAGETLVCVLTVGQFDAPGTKDKVILNRLHKRKPISARITADFSLPTWLAAAMEGVRLAPSAVNAQAPHFSWQGGVATATIDDEHPMHLVDLGIAKQNFVQVAGGSFALGRGGSYTPDDHA
ncbi:MAG: nitroreductase family protein [Clostridia bacterium]|nr:nitroreductase family protein [Clostridia bacterium]